MLLNYVTMATDLNLFFFPIDFMTYFQLDHIQTNLYQMKEKKQSFPNMYTCIGLLIEIRGTELKNASWYKTPRQLPKNMTVKGLRPS